MERLKAPKFDNEAQEADWLYEHREELAAEFIDRHDEAREQRVSRLEGVLSEALRGKRITFTSKEIKDRSPISALKKKLRRPQ